MKFTHILVAALACSAVAGSAFAQTTTTRSSAAPPAQPAAEQGPPNPFTQCGIGAAIFPTVKWAAVSSNIIWDYGITATTSAVSTPGSCAGKRAKTAYFIMQTYPTLEAQTAVGEGEYLTALTDTMECAPEARSVLISDVRARMADVMSKPDFAGLDRAHKAEAYYNVVNAVADAMPAAQCYRS